MIGQLLDGRYRIASKLGEGGFGHTYLAHDTRIPNEPLCVVKHLKPVSDDREYLKVSNRLFTSEAQILAKLGDHDRIPRLLAYFEQAGEFYLVEEFVEGRSLELELVRGYRMGEAQVIQILDDLLSILEYIHGQGVIHRDLKPDNIIRRKSDGKFVLIDFGAIKQVQNQMTQEGQTVATVAIGTLGYMPSEQAQGKPRPSSDLYAIGVIGIQALTGLQPRELQEDYQTGELIWQHLVPNRTGLVEVLTKMTRYHYKDRYESASEIRKVLASLGSHHLPTHQSVQSTNNVIQSTVVITNYDLGTEVLPKVPPIQPYSPAIAPNPIPAIQPLIQPLPAPTTPLSPPTTPVNQHPAPSENPPQYTVQVSTSDQTGDNKGSKGLWIAVWVAAFATAVAIGALMATLKASNNLNPVANNPTVTPSQNTTSATSSSTSIETASPTANPKTSPFATVNPTPSPIKANANKNEIVPLSESEAVDLVNNLVAAKNQIFGPPFNRQLLAELTTGEAYEKRKGSIDWLQNNNAFYRYGDFKVSRAGSFGIQDNQANVTVEIFESPTLYVNGRIDQSQSQPSRGRYVCTFLFENGRWKVSNLTKVD
ncbi:MAG TPA: serine/threonine protein kinase [Pseudanabaena sp.]|nr:serine/threonine protein kinase [Pseudanabaena sp.]